jgi:hypothetical protein
MFVHKDICIKRELNLISFNQETLSPRIGPVYILLQHMLKNFLSMTARFDAEK